MITEPPPRMWLYDFDGVPDSPTHDLTRTQAAVLNPVEESVISKRSGSLRELLSFAFPLIIAHMSLSMMWVVDTLIMGHVGTVEQGAVGLGGVLAWAVTSFFMGTVSIVNVFVAQDFGAKRRDLARHVRSAVFLTIPMAICIGALWFLVPAGLKAIGATANVLPHAQTYIQIRLYSAPFLLISAAITSYLRGVGDMLTPMLISISANIVNAALASLLVFGLVGLPPMGVAGAAWGTTLAGTFELVCYILVFLFSKKTRLHGSRNLALPSLTDLRLFVQHGVPIGLTWLFEMVTWTSFSAYAGTRTPNELAAHTIIFQVMGFCFMPAVAIGIAASTLVGQYIGANRPDLASRSARRALLAGMAYMSSLGIGLILMRFRLVSAFNPDPHVIAIGATIALMAALYQPFDAFGIVSQGILRGAGHTAGPTFVMLGSGLFVFIPLVYILGERVNLGIIGAWMAATAHVVTVALVLGVILASGKWKNGRRLDGNDNNVSQALPINNI